MNARLPPSMKIGRSSNSGWTAALLLAPAVVWIAVFFLVPLGLMIWKSLIDRGIEPYYEILSSPIYLRVLGSTFQICLVTTVGCLIFGYPVALALTLASTPMRAIMLPLVILPYWLDYIVRSYSWKILLGRRGMINEALVYFGITDEPLKLLYNLFAVSIGMIQILLPLMILTLFAAMSRIGSLFDSPETLYAEEAIVDHHQYQTNN